MRNVHIYTDGPAPVFKNGPPNVRVTDCAANCGCKNKAAAVDALITSVRDGSMTLRDANIELVRLKINGTIIWDGTVYRQIAA